MTEAVSLILSELIGRYPQLAQCQGDIAAAYETLAAMYSEGGILLIAGNGGSASDAEHIVGELMKSFVKARPVNVEYAEALRAVDPEMGGILAERLQGTLPAIALDGEIALSTAYMNDCDPLLCFAQQVNGYGTPCDAFLGISTSGNSRNVLYAAVAAKAKGMKVIGLTGAAPSKLSSLADVCIRVPESQTYKIQELHLPVYHALCMMLEATFWA